MYFGTVSPERTFKSYSRTDREAKETPICVGPPMLPYVLATHFP